jgi:hypothetical protein
MTAAPLRRIGLSIPLVLMATLAPGFAAWGAKANRANNDVQRFDGAWSVVIITDQGTCDRTYRYGLHIAGGRVSYSGGNDVSVSGQVDAFGRVSVEVRSGGSSASGTGRMTESDGEGQWRGRSQDSGCSGRWQAERRGQ